MKKIFYGLFFAILVSLPGRLAAQPQEEPKFVPAENAIWTEDTDTDGVISKFTKGDECYIIIRRFDGTNQDGVAIKTTGKPTKTKDGLMKKPVIQWNFFVRNTMGKKKYSFSFWGENQEEATGPEISANCTKYLPELLPETQKELRKYGAMK